ncbi:MAG TPA: hypothetical protein PK059_02125 [Cyclobacteriaceae bacterium]|nr:hypothetical protein [Cyclobacteriaceae bacterium]
MSNEQAKHIDMIVTWSFRGIVGLCCFACASIFQNMSSDVTVIKIDQSDMKGDIKGIKSELLERGKADDRRDRAIEELQRTLNNRK